MHRLLFLSPLLFACSSQVTVPVAVEQPRLSLPDATPTSPSIAAADAVGAVAGELQVTDDGIATFKIPLPVAPGRAGLQPDLSLLYGSHFGDGLLGRGWALSEIPAITRCPSTYAQDGFLRGIQYGASDRFCLGGERMVAVQGDYGGPSTVYYLEHNRWLRIESVDRCGGGPCSFRVRAPDGRTSSFGASVDSRLLAEGRSDVRQWSCDKVRDRHGNNMTFTYDTGKGVLYPLRIDYTANETAGHQPERSVRFSYEARAGGLVPRYSGQSIVFVDRRLHSVAAYVFDQPVSYYQLIYGVTTSTGEDRIDAVQECDSPQRLHCVAPTQFKYNDTFPLGFRSATASAQLGGWTASDGPQAHRYLTFDADGDGRDDVVDIHKGTGNSTEYTVYRSNGTALSRLSAGKVTDDWVDVDSPHSYRIIPIDMDGDGLKDLVWLWRGGTSSVPQTTYSVWRNIGGSFAISVNDGSTLGNWSDLDAPDARRFVPLDADGDGLADLVELYKATLDNGEIRTGYTVWRNIHGRFTRDTPGDIYAKGTIGDWTDVNVADARRYLPVDADGDGLVNLIEVYRHPDNGTAAAQVWRNNGKGFEKWGPGNDFGPWFNQSAGMGATYLPLDVNGDGLTDVVQIYPATLSTNTTAGSAGANVLINRGTSFAKSPSAMGGWRQANRWIGAATGHVLSGCMRGEPKPCEDYPGHYVKSNNVYERRNSSYLTADLNGDGRTDIVELHPDPANPQRAAAQLWISNGGEFKNQGAYALGGWWEPSDGDAPAFLPMDFQGHGVTDIVEISRSGDDATAQAHLSLRQPAQNTLATVTDGLNNNYRIQYVTLTDASVYTRGSGAPFPVDVDAVLPGYTVVSHHQFQAAGQAQPSRFDYRWSGARINMQGRGFLGFAAHEIDDHVEDDETQTRTTRVTLQQSFPYTGMHDTIAVRQKSTGKTLTSSTTHYEAITGQDNTYRVRETSSVDAKFDGIADGAYQTTTNTLSYDEYDNVTQFDTRAETMDGAQRAERFSCASYRHDTVGWDLRSALASKISSAPCLDGFAAWRPGVDLRWGQHDFDDLGDVVTEREWDDVHAAWAVTTREYDAVYGNQIALTPPGRVRSSLVYDQPTSTFVERRETPAVGAIPAMSTQSSYNLRFGAVTRQVDANGVSGSTSLDWLGRTVDTFGPDPRNPSLQVQLQHTDYSPNTADGFGIVVTRRVRPDWAAGDPSSWHWQQSYLDSLGRSHHTRNLGNEGTVQVQDLEFDSEGRTRRTSLPYLEGQSPRYDVTDYDVFGEPVRTRHALGGVTTVDHQRAAFLVTYSGPNPNDRETPSSNRVTSQRRFDIAGHLVEQTSANGAVVQYQYDLMGQNTGHVERAASDAEPRAVTLVYDSRGQVIERREPDTGVTRSSYDLGGQLVRVEDARGAFTEMQYDPLGRAIAVTSDDGGVNPLMTTMEYDDPSRRFALGRATRVRETRGDSESYVYEMAYDPFGNLAARTTKLFDRTYAFAYARTPFGAPAETTLPDGTRLRSHFGSGLGVDRLCASRFGELRGGSGCDAGFVSLAHWSGFDAFGATSSSLGNGAASLVRRDGRGRPVQIDHLASGGTSGLRQDLTWSRANKLIAIDDRDQPERSSVFTYTAVGQLASATRGGVQREFEYSGFDLTKHESQPLAYLPGTHQVSTLGDHVQFAYDAAGNRTEKRTDDEVWSYHFDPRGQLAEIDHRPLAGGKGAGTVDAFTYDLSGTRLSKSDGAGTVTLYVGAEYEVVLSKGREVHTRYAGGASGPLAAWTEDPASPALLAAIDANTAAVRAAMASGKSVQGATAGLVWRARAAANRLVAARIRLGDGALGAALVAFAAFVLLAAGRERRRQIGAVVSISLLVTFGAGPAFADVSPGPNGAGVPQSGLRFFQRDQVQSTALVTDAHGREVSRLVYHPFGAVDAAASKATDDFRSKFDGHETDAENGLQYFGARYYDPTIGQFISADPARQYFSPYQFVANDPIVGVDADGRFGWAAVGAVLLVVGFGLAFSYLGGVSASGGQWNPFQWEASSELFTALAVGFINGIIAGLSLLFGAKGVVVTRSAAATGTQAAKKLAKKAFFVAVADLAVTGISVAVELAFAIAMPFVDWSWLPTLAFALNLGFSFISIGLGLWDIFLGWNLLWDDLLKFDFNFPEVEIKISINIDPPKPNIDLPSINPELSVPNLDPKAELPDVTAPTVGVTVPGPKVRGLGAIGGGALGTAAGGYYFGAPGAIGGGSVGAAVGHLIDEAFRHTVLQFARNLQVPSRLSFLGAWGRNFLTLAPSTPQRWASGVWSRLGWGAQ